jgi:hypothetical protein
MGASAPIIVEEVFFRAYFKECPREKRAQKKYFMGEPGFRE